ncbi:prolyl-tRNA synthetase associated domain-containing protein [Methylopila sp. Yamaguchi]|uniref:prolyl-tRNA synthetase associated domain-containing protein n=1 Tax=Methylopila sp. Yamaguchi TaxID=1437817 RepID=UPI000CBF03A7|nr:prolyl-tRNA synthetase associated domain-containing protein [Methylopila sp. Yamaguchi]GBD50371.1 YbaK/prolyl-tRNA synthetase associated domain-containing protein [Methylopila sp. Yamaguchi]
MATPDDLFAKLAELGLAVATREHAPVLTVDEMMAVTGDLPDAHTKNLFLRDGKKTYFLVTMRHDQPLDLKALRGVIGARGGLSFASTEALEEHLGVKSGAVSPFAALNDAGGAVRVCLEEALMRAETINVHPLTNDRTTAIAPADLVRFLVATGHEPLTFSVEAAA